MSLSCLLAGCSLRAGVGYSSGGLRAEENAASVLCELHRLALFPQTGAGGVHRGLHGTFGRSSAAAGCLRCLRRRGTRGSFRQPGVAKEAAVRPQLHIRTALACLAFVNPDGRCLE
ncbi:hypothetical protein HPB50_004499 [Hyalomma asiaticum]|uniref:Uncharacterized protein n=1 Tax=Hyalomma asiaticum TaxID=266040 RepID=A0ACB7TCL4_HYAAI|nr:hypothetical protein HPB50_004499 [Hyalomma asiaticum]